MPIPAYRAKQSTDTAGTGTIVLNAANSNARSFAQAFGASSRRVMYAISWSSGFELGLGDFDGGTPGNLTRATVLASSNAGALVTLPAGTKDVFAVFAPAAREMVSISATSTLALADIGNAVVFTGSSAATLNLPAVATVPLGAGFTVWNTGTAALTIDPNGAETINGAATLTLQAGAFVEVLRLSVGWSASVPALPSSGGTLSGGLLNVAGTVGAPAYSFASDTDTGIYNSAPNELAFATNGTFRGRFDTTGFQVNSQDGARLGAVGATSFARIGSSLNGETALDVSYDRSAGAAIISLGTVGGAFTERMRITSGAAINMAGPVNVNSGGQTVTGDLEASGNLRFNSGYGSAAIAYGVRAWVNFNGTGTVTIRGSGGVTSITDNNVGDYTVNFNFTLPDTNYAAVGNAGPNTATIAAGILIPVIRTTTNCRILTSDNNTDTLFDYANIDLLVVR